MITNETDTFNGLYKLNWSEKTVNDKYQIKGFLKACCAAMFNRLL